jgi:photosystem II stability/assembly factor-like uncharacterized protein
VSWTRLPFEPPDVFSVAVSPADGAIYAGCEPSMLFRSDDGGQSWRPFNEGLKKRAVYHLAFDARGRVLFAGSSQGVLEHSFSADPE